MRIALYVRVSTERQADQGMSMDDQVAVMKKWAHDKGHVIVEIFEEPGASAYALERRRPVFDRMVGAALSPEKPFDLIVVHAQNRFYRRNAEREILERKLGQNGVQLVIFGQPRPEDERSSFLVRNVTGILDELQSLSTGVRVADCMRANAVAGYFNGSKPPYGYRIVATDIPARSGVKKILVVDDEEAEVVRRIFRLARFGKDGLVMGMKRIAEELNASGLQHRGTKWTIRHVEMVLENSACIGELVTFKRNSHTNRPHPREEWVTTQIPAILGRDEFDAVHRVLATRRPPNTDNRAAQVPTLLTGLLICGRCNKGLTLATGKSGRYKYYRCASKQKISPSACSCPNLPKERLDRLVLTALIERVLSTERVAGIMGELMAIWKDAKQPDPKRLQLLRTRLAALDAALGRMYEQVAKKNIDLDSTLQAHIRRKQHERETVEAELRGLEARQHLPFRKVSREHIEEFLSIARTELGDPDNPLARQYLRALVTEIRVDAACCRIRGNRAQLASAMSHWSNMPGEVPSDASDWRARLGSNQQPLPSEGSTLSIELRARVGTERTERRAPQNSVFAAVRPSHSGDGVRRNAVFSGF